MEPCAGGIRDEEMADDLAGNGVVEERIFRRQGRCRCSRGRYQETDDIVNSVGDVGRGGRVGKLFRTSSGTVRPSDKPIRSFQQG